MDDFLEFLGGLFLIVLFGIAFVFFITLLCWPLLALDCRVKANVMGLERSYGPIQGCMIKVNGKYIPLESYRVVRNEK